MSAAAQVHPSSSSKEVKCYVCNTAGAKLEPGTIKRRDPAPNDVAIDIRFAGICHSDIHQAKEEWGKAIFPMVPGHEIGGVVTSVGSSVTKFKVGDIVGVGCMVGSCKSCRNCKKNEEQFCSSGATYTYNSTYHFDHETEKGQPTYGGYSQHIVVEEDFVCSIPTNLDLAAATPLLCAGITVWSPIARFGLNSSHKFAVVGLGGLGHMAVKFGVAIGANVTVISRGTGKKDNALNTLKAHNYIDSTNADEMKAAAGSFDLIINCIAADHNVGDYLALLDLGGHMCMVGVPPSPLAIHAFQLIAPRKTIGGSLIGGVKETQEMLEFCGKNNIVCDIETIKADYINEAYERTIKSDVKYRFVIDVATI